MMASLDGRLALAKEQIMQHTPRHFRRLVMNQGQLFDSAMSSDGGMLSIRQVLLSAEHI